jgi:hypothetical protein
MLMTVTMLVPLLVFTAWEVDLSAWQTRVTEIQRAADAAALAGTVWMPNLQKAQTVALDSLKMNGFTNGVDDISVSIAEGATPTSLKVTLTDASVQRFFSGLFAKGKQGIVRSAEAVYYLPLPLGSPLNYFGGDATKTQGVDSVAWPTPYGSTTWPPTNPTCNVGTSAGQGFGQWTSSSNYSASGYSGSTRCRWTARLVTTSSNATSQVPANVPCNRIQSPTSNLGRWEAGVLGLTLHTYNAGARYSSGTGNRQCQWAVSGTEPPDYATRVPLNVPCNVTGELTRGSWNLVLGINTFLPVSLLAANLCQWDSSITPASNPIAAGRSPGFWAQAEGPGTVTAYGDAFSTKCTTAQNCGSTTSAQYRSSGYWYVIKIPDSGVNTTTISVFDANYRRDGTITADTGDYNLGAASTTTNPDFITEYRVYKQLNPLDVTIRTPIDNLVAGNQADNSCWWSVTNQAAFTLQWRPLCTINPAAGDTYLLNVKTSNPTGVQGAGLNGYALQAIAAGTAQPALYAYGDMGMFNNGSGTFYLAEVAPSFAGKVLAIDLWDPGDVSSGTATIYPKMPSATQPKPVVDAPSTCTYTSGPDPNAVNTGSPTWGATGVRYATAHASDSATKCAVNTAPSGTAQRFNDEWLRIRIQIPANYTCTPGLNPETTAGSCWWGIQYVFSSQPYDVTTWKARIEGSPVHLTD